MNYRFSNGQIAAASGVCTDISYVLSDGVIIGVGEAATADITIDLCGGYLLPGFIDTQVNGGGGILFNDDISVLAIAKIAAAHASFGTTGLLPTLISESPLQILKALDVVDRAIAQKVPGVLGLHIEGPFINAARRGIHAEEKILPLDSAVMDALLSYRLGSGRGKIILTIAPEIVGPSEIAALTKAGIIVSLGHSDGNYEQAMAALAAGASGFTHLFNAMSPLNHRAPAMVGAAFDAPEAFCGLIADKAHVHPAVVRLAVRAKGAGHIMLVTDSMPSVGTNQDSFTLQGQHIFVKDGICTDAAGTLAGSDLNMATALANIVDMCAITPIQAAAMTSGTAASFLGLSDTHGSLGLGQRADWVWLDKDLKPKTVWIGGVPVYGQENIAGDNEGVNYG